MKQYLTFQLANVNYGIHIMDVREIRSFEKPTKMISANTFVKGVLDLRGEIVPIISLRDKFNLPKTDDESSIVIIISIDDKSAGIMVDSVSDVIDINDDDVHDASKIVNVSYASGLYTDSTNKMVVLIKTAEFISINELIEV